MRSERIHNIIYPVMAIIIAISFLIIPITSFGTRIARAEASAYSDVMDDLQKAENFDVNDYPLIPSDYSLKVIQIAESQQGELLIYVYQPAADKAVKASSVNIAREMDNSAGLGFKNYRLDYQSSSGVFYKYRVNDFELRTDTVRYYNISNIMRPFIKGVDKEPADGQTVSEVGIKVAQFWTACTANDVVTYTVLTSEVITITQKVVGYCVYDDGLNLGWGAMEGITKAYFVAFDTDRPIDKLISADLTFFATRISCKYCANDKHDHKMFYDFGEGEYIDFGTGVYNDEPLTITDKQSFGNVGGGNVRPATKFLQKRIRKTSDFIADNNNKDYQLTSSGEEKLDGTQWVLNFYECQDKYKVNNVWLSFIPGVNLITGVADGEAELNNVYDVSILRLEFETNGERFNLGVVDNKQTGNDQFNEYIGGCNCSWLKALPRWAWLLIVVFAPLILFLLIKLIVWLVNLPFKAASRRRSKRRIKKSLTKQTKPKKKKTKKSRRA